MKTVKKRVLSHLFFSYLKLLEKTVKIEWVNENAFAFNHVVGFWHEDSFAMNLVLKHMKEREETIEVLVTADERGEYIQHMIEKCGGKAVRIGYGFCNAGTMKELLRSLKSERKSLAIAMDGPLGPRYVPKKMTFFLSEKSRSELVGVTLSYSRKLALKSRWDHYRIPLPFSKIKVQFDNYGVADSRSIPHVKTCQQSRECGLILPEMTTASEQSKVRASV